LVFTPKIIFHRFEVVA